MPLRLNETKPNVIANMVPLKIWKAYSGGVEPSSVTFNKFKSKEIIIVTIVDKSLENSIVLSSFMFCLDLERYLSIMNMTNVNKIEKHSESKINR